MRQMGWSQSTIRRSIGVVGHTDLRLQDVSAIRSSLERWFFREDARNPGAQVELMTGLQPGAEQLTTWVATRRTTPPRVVLLVPARDDSHQIIVREKTLDLEGCDSDSLRDLADEEKVIQLPSCQPPALGFSRYLGEHATVLLAIWDGVYGRDQNGVGDAVRYALSDKCQRIRAAARREAIEVHWLAVPRIGNCHPAAEAFTWQDLLTPFSPAKLTVHPWRYRFRKLQLLLPVVLAIASVSITVWGYCLNATSVGSTRKSIGDFALPAISHLTLNDLSVDVSGPGTELIRIGLWLSVAFALATLASLVEGIFRWIEELARLWTCSRPHDLVCGLGWRGRSFIADTAEARISTIAIEATPDESSRELCSRMGVSLIERDATDANVIKKVGIRHLRCAFVSCGSDEVNMQVAHQLAIAAAGKPFVCCVDLRVEDRFQVLQNALPVGHRVDLRIFNTEAVTSRMLLQSQALDRFMASGDAGGADLIVLGDSAMARALIHQSLQQGIFESGKFLRIAWMVNDATTVCASFREKYPIYQEASSQNFAGVCRASPEGLWLDYGVLPTVEFFELPSSDRALIDAFQIGSVLRAANVVTSVIVADSDPAVSASLAHAIAPWLERYRLERDRDVSLSCYYNVWDDIYRSNIEHAVNKDFPELPIRVFSDFMGKCSKHVVRGDDIDRAARRVNGIFSLPPETWRDSEFNQICTELWRSLPEDEKESNRQAAAHAWTKRRVRSRLRRLGVDDKAIEAELAEMEHRRWCAEHLLAGFRPLMSFSTYADETNQEERRLVREWFSNAQMKKRLKREKRHADLLPFYAFEQVFTGSIAASEKAKDFTQIRALDIIIGDSDPCEVYESSHPRPERVV
jgi:hypothetical protein